MSSEKKSRSARFTPAMSEALVQAYQKYQFILQAKFSETVSLEKKKGAWGYVADAVNAVNSGEKKSVEQIKKRWEDMTGNVKKKEREARNKELRRLRVTGNGHLEDEDDENAAKLSEPCTESLTPSEKEIAIILGPQTFTGIPGGHDSMETVGQASKENISEENVEVDVEEVSLTAETNHTASVFTKDSKSGVQASFQLGQRKRPPPKSLAQAQLEYFETVTAYYKLKMKKVAMEIDLMKEEERVVKTTVADSEEYYLQQNMPPDFF